jgi:peptide/nickel transport system ATP-binding protein
VELMQLVGLDVTRRNRYPHEFSGGQRQRIGIARAIALNPKFIVADEAVSALDVSVQSQVLNLLMKLQKELGLTYLFIAHGLNVVRHISDRIGVMYLGKMVEVAKTEELFAKPLHPYTSVLLSAIPQPKPNRKQERIVLQGDVPSPANPPSGCRFHPRCPYAKDKCRVDEPALAEIFPSRQVSCHYPLV